MSAWHTVGTQKGVLNSHYSFKVVASQIFPESN